MAPLTVSWHRGPALDTAPWLCQPRFHCPLTAPSDPVEVPGWAHTPHRHSDDRITTLGGVEGVPCVQTVKPSEEGLPLMTLGYKE